MSTDVRSPIGWEWDGPRVLVTAIKAVLRQHASARVHVEWFESLDYGADITLIIRELTALGFSAPRRAHAAGDAGFYRHLIQELIAGCSTEVCDEPRRRRLLEASEILGRATLTLALETSVLERLREAWAGVQQHVVVVHVADSADMSWLRWLLGVLNEVYVRQIVVFSPEKPPGEFLKPDIYWPSFLEMICRIDEEMAADPKQLPLDSRPEGIIGFWKRLFLRPSGTAASTPAPPTKPATRFIQDDRWRYFFAKQTFPSHGLARRLWEAIVKTDELVEAAARGGRSPVDNRPSANPKRDNHERARNLSEATRSELEILRGRARFLATLKILRPAVYEAARESIDGADQFYRLQLVLCGGAKESSALSGALLPEWQRLLQDTRLVELFRSAFSDLNAQGFPLIQRFESRNQLEFHMAWLEGHERQTDMNNARDIFRKWILQNGNGTPALVPDERLDAAALQANAILLSGSDQLEIALMILADAELFGEFSNLGATLELLDRALGNSVGAVRLECLLTRSRILALQEEFMAARELLRGLRRAYTDSLAYQAIALHESFVRECERDFYSAMRGYIQVLRVSEELAADELSARAVLGYLRSQATMRLAPTKQDVSQDSKELIRLRANIMVQVQTARAPQLFPLSKRDRPRIFLSYRSESRTLVASLHERLRSDFLPWYDKDLEEHEDFSPTIHSELLDSDVVVFMFSPRFFESPWCVHELHFAIGQQEVRAMPLFWCWCDPHENGTDRGVDLAMEQWKVNYLQTIANPSDPQQVNYHRRHVEDRFGRVLSVGTRLHPLVVRVPATREEAANATDPLVDAIMKRRKFLYERAVLPEPQSELADHS